MSTNQVPSVTAARIAYLLAQEFLPLYSHPKSPHRYTFPQLAACVLLALYLRLNYRDMEEWLLTADEVRAVLGLKSVPNYSTLSRAHNRLRRMGVLAQMWSGLLEEMGVRKKRPSLIAQGIRPHKQAPIMVQSDQHAIPRLETQCPTHCLGNGDQTFRGD